MLTFPRPGLTGHTKAGWHGGSMSSRRSFPKITQTSSRASDQMSATLVIAAWQAA
jgi:hypothetical protein